MIVGLHNERARTVTVDIGMPSARRLVLPPAVEGCYLLIVATRQLEVGGKTCPSPQAGAITIDGWRGRVLREGWRVKLRAKGGRWTGRARKVAAKPPSQPSANRWEMPAYDDATLEAQADMSRHEAWTDADASET